LEKMVSMIILSNTSTQNMNSGPKFAEKTRKVARSFEVEHRSPVECIVRFALVARLTEVVGSRLEEDARDDDDDDDDDEEVEVEVVSGDDVCDEDVRSKAVEEVRGLLEEEEEEAGGSEEETTGVVEEGEKMADEDVCSLREELLDVEVLTLALDEVETAVLLA
jgi:hypothetical protein